MSISSNLATLGALMKTNLETKGVNGLNSNMGLTTLANKILDIPNTQPFILAASKNRIHSNESIHLVAVLNETELSKNLPVEFTVRSSGLLFYFEDESDLLAAYSEDECTIDEPCTFQFKLHSSIATCRVESGNSIVTIDVGGIINQEGSDSICKLVWDGSELTLYVNLNDRTANYLSSSSFNKSDITFYCDNCEDVYITERCESPVYINSFVNPDTSGVASISYTGGGVGDLICTAKHGTLTKTVTVEDYMFNPLLDGNDSITKWTNMTNTTGNGVFTSHGSFLTDGWSNNGNWQLDFDVKANDWKYVGLMPICDANINPFTDAKVANYAFTTWEGITYGGGFGSSVVSQDTLSKITDTSNWHHYRMEKLSATKIRVTIDNTYKAVLNVPNLANIQTLHIGTRDNPSSRNTGGLIQFKNIKVKSIS